jgi:hypothetical protein
MAEEIDIYSAGETEILSQDGVSHSPENSSNKSPEGKLVEIENVLQKQRDEWGAKLVELINKIKNVEQLPDAQVDMLSYRQILVEQLTKFRIRSRKTETTYERQFKTKFLSYFNYDYKINDKQKVDMVNADLFFYRRQLGLLDAQIEFFKESISTLDKMGFAIKNRVNFEEI